MRVAFAPLVLPVLVLVQSSPRFVPSPPSPPTYISVAASTSAPSVKPGGRLLLQVDVVPKPGIHVYAPGAKGYSPIALTLLPQKNMMFGTTVYPTSEALYFAPTKETVAVYQRPFRLTRPMTVTGPVKIGTVLSVAGSVEYQACDDRICFVPASVPVNWTIAIR